MLTSLWAEDPSLPEEERRTCHTHARTHTQTHTHHTQGVCVGVGRYPGDEAVSVEGVSAWEHEEALCEQTTVADLTACLRVHKHTPDRERERERGGREREGEREGERATVTKLATMPMYTRLYWVYFVICLSRDLCQGMK